MEHSAIAPQHLGVASSNLSKFSNQTYQHSEPVRSTSDSQSNCGSNTKTGAPRGHSSRFPAMPSSHGTPPLNNTISYAKHESPHEFSKWRSKWINDWWGGELACCGIAVLSLVAIVALLESHKNQPVPQWHFGITLNSYISIFTTIGQMAMTQPIVECISQLKWLWFQRKKKLSGFQAFDNASRGLPGSLVLLWKLRGVHLGSLGAAIMVVSATFGPFAQQVVTYPLHLHSIEAASVPQVPQVFNFTSSSLYTGAVSPSTYGAMYEGIAISNSSLSTVAPFCSTGNCTWVEYSSLGVCGSVTDLSLTIINNTCSNLTAFEEIFRAADLVNPGYPCFNYTLPEQALIDFTSLTSSAGSYMSNATLSNAFAEAALNTAPMKILTLRPSYSNISSGGTLLLMYQPGLLASINSTLPSPIAYALNLNLCIQTYNTTVLNGKTNTTILSSRILETDIVVQTYSAVNDTIYFNTINGSYVSIAGNVFGISSEALQNFNLAVQSLCSTCYDFIIPVSEGPGAPSQSLFCDFVGGYSFLVALENASDPFSAISEQWGNMATSMTNAFRNGAGGDTMVGQFSGTAFAPVPYVQTNYLWLILPISLVALTFFFLVATIRKSKRLGSRVWKSSNLATLQGLNSELHTKLGGLSSITEMEEKAKDVEVRFNSSLKNLKGEHDIEYRLVESK